MTFGKRSIYLGSSNTNHFDSLDKVRKSVVDKVKTFVCCIKQENHSKENIMKIKYANEFVQNLGIVGTTAYAYQFIYDKSDNYATKIIQYL